MENVNELNDNELKDVNGAILMSKEEIESHRGYKLDKYDRSNIGRKIVFIDYNRDRYYLGTLLDIFEKKVNLPFAGDATNTYYKIQLKDGIVELRYGEAWNYIESGAEGSW